MIKPQTLKGFRDFLPKDALKRQSVIEKIIATFERFGFDPLETPALEYAETLLGKYGDEADKLLYIFKDNGGRNVGLRYDQTVPASRVVAQYQQQLPNPFKRYQIQPVWRAENTQKGRFREFLQCDADIFGTESLFADAEIIVLTGKALQALGINAYKILINDRQLFNKIIEKGIIKDENQLPTILRSLDKIQKIGERGVMNELQEKGFSPDVSVAILQNAKAMRENDRLLKIIEACNNMGEEKLLFSPNLARGLDYYTSTIFEVEIEGYESGSVCGGGRYDHLIGQFTGTDVPAVGFAFGFDRLMEALDQLNLLPAKSTATRVLVTVFSGNLFSASLSLTSQLRNKGINTEVSLETIKLDKQLKYADRKGIPYVIIQGPEEIKKGVVKLKDMKSQTQEEMTVDEVIQKLKT
ncbi:MAG: histidine--tRNA ligase [Patescibacteria group bacterium]